MSGLRGFVGGLLGSPAKSKQPDAPSPSHTHTDGNPASTNENQKNSHGYAKTDAAEEPCGVRASTNAVHGGSPKIEKEALLERAVFTPKLQPAAQQQREQEEEKEGVSNENAPPLDGSLKAHFSVKSHRSPSTEAVVIDPTHPASLRSGFDNPFLAADGSRDSAFTYSGIGSPRESTATLPSVNSRMFASTVDSQTVTRSFGSALRQNNNSFGKK